MISIIVAMGKNRVIGSSGQLPWRLPDDMLWFRETTMDKPVIMGRKTYASIPAKFRPLEGRHNIVLTRDETFEAEGATVVHSAEAALAAAADADEIMIAGGSEIYAQFLPQTERIYLTLVDDEPVGDALFPEIEWSEWKEAFMEPHGIDERHAHAFQWMILLRK